MESTTAVTAEFLLKYCSTHWLYIDKVLVRMLEQCFLSKLPTLSGFKGKKWMGDSERMKVVNNPLVFPCMMLIVCVCNIIGYLIDKLPIGLSTTATTLICNAWKGTKQQYNSTLCRWGEFCRAREIHPVTRINDVVEFLSLYADGGRFGVIATARSAWGNFIHVPGVPVLSNHPLIQKVAKGAYNTRPPAPRYVVIWDTDVLLQYLDSMDNVCLNFKSLSCKTVILLTILSGAIFNLGTTMLKHSRPGRSTPPIVLHRYPHGRQLYPLKPIRDYATQRTLIAPQID